MALHRDLRLCVSEVATRPSLPARCRYGAGARFREGGLRRGGGSLGGGLWSDPNQTLAEVLASVEACDRTWCLLDSVEDVLSIADLSVAHPVLEFPQSLGKALGMVKDQKALHSRAFDEKMTLDPWALGVADPSSRWTPCRRSPPVHRH